MTDRSVIFSLISGLNMLSPLVLNELWGSIQQVNREAMMIYQDVMLGRTRLSTWCGRSKKSKMRLFVQFPCDLVVAEASWLDPLRDHQPWLFQEDKRTGDYDNAVLVLWT